MDDAIFEIEALKKKVAKFEVNFGKCSRANRTKGYLKGRLEGLDELWTKVCDADDNIEALKTVENANEKYFEDDQFGTLEKAYYRLKGEIQDQLDRLNPQVVVNTNASGNNQNQNGSHQNNESKVKLPKISLPSFEGSYHTWLSFKNRFTNLIHDSKSLSNVEKLEYLKSCVTDKAETAIQRFQITDLNYKAAWDRLNEIYDNKWMLQDTQIETIIDRKEVKIETSKELRELLDVVQESLEALKNMQVDTDTWDPILVVIIKRKLPFKTREEWEKELDPKDVPTYAQLIAFLEKRFRTVENLELVGGETAVGAGSKSQNTYKNENSNQSANQRTKCLACNNVIHSLMICDTFLNMTLSNRNAFVTAKKLCRNCLGVGHIIKDCKSSKRCFKCNRSHNTLLHKEDQSQSHEPSYTGHNPFSQNLFSSNHNQNSGNQRRTYVTNSQIRTQSNQEGQTTQHTQQNQNQLNPNAAPYANQNQSRSLVTKAIWNTEPVLQTQNHRSDNDAQSIQSNQPQQKRAYTTTSVQQPVKTINPNYNQISENETLFPTAIVQIKSADGAIVKLRALLDQCSGEVYIKESVAKMLGTKQVSIPPFDVTGLEDVVTSRVEKSTHLQMIIEEKDVLEFEAHIVKNLVGILPTSIVRWPEKLFKNIKLADTNFATPNNVDIMLGIDVYTYILLGGVLKEGGYLAQNTKLGWIISGKSDEIIQPTKQKSLCGFTRKKVELKREVTSYSGYSRKYYAPIWLSNLIDVNVTNQRNENLFDDGTRTAQHNT